jgi:choline dehydrogenase
LQLRSADPAIHPAIDPAYFDDQVDLDAMLAGMRANWETCRQGPLAQFLDRPWELPDDPTDDDLLEHVRRRAQTLFHPVATCAMGSGEDAVVDRSLHGRGIGGLRDVAAAVMPAVPRGNTNAPTIMIAEKAAEEIRKSA